MKRKSILAALLTTVLLATNGVSVFASNVNVIGDTATGNTPTSFEVDTNILGGDLVVSIPADLTLTYDSASGTFKDTDVVTANGRILASKKLEVKTPTTVTYKNEDDNSITVDGTIAFGTTSGDYGVEEWSASELLTSITSPVEKDITATVNKTNISYIGTYKATVTYNISVVDK